MWTSIAELVALLIAVSEANEVPAEWSTCASKLAADSSLLQVSARFEQLDARGTGHRLLSQTSRNTDPLEGAQESPLDRNCGSPCTFDGESHLCRDRVRWLVEAGGSTIADALNIVSYECDGQCTCSLHEFHCDSSCMFEGENHTCKDRVQWLVQEGGSTLPDALDTVSNECAGQCMCSGADFIQENSSEPAPPPDEDGELETTPATWQSTLVQPRAMDGEIEALESARDLPLDFLCDTPCMFEGGTHSCKARVQWLVKEEGSAVADALDIVSDQCTGQCMCRRRDFLCESTCMFNGETHSCRERVGWLVRNGMSTVAAALDTVSQECDGQCMCSPSDFDCESPCMLEGEAHSCRHRVQWLVGEGSTVIDAFNAVSHECSGQCVCSAADFGVEENSSTTAMPTTSEIDADQTLSTTAMQDDTLEPGAGLTTSEIDADQTWSTTAVQRDTSEPGAGLTTTEVDDDPTISTTLMQSDTSEPLPGDGPTTTAISGGQTTRTTTAQSDISEPEQGVEPTSTGADADLTTPTTTTTQNETSAPEQGEGPNSPDSEADPTMSTTMVHSDASEP